ncbi:alpha/beta fold hydrolase [[Mycobacterium] wendilense]|uniref:Alpha/beta fold hydrolase n=1 Tax=[Mycobacterium] wendilense TaxID=3064284 RepID=A0ABM9MEM6_9MYCO|nr:alpha/beta fold hydrolase [Mycolicibacterium sp. MU0050]CAJ1583358.1 alpha/beta fold hydrolase [Mycolicibacterium sp. MU0050]
MPSSGQSDARSGRQIAVAPTGLAVAVDTDDRPRTGPRAAERGSARQPVEHPKLQGRALGIDIAAVMTSSAATGVLGFAFWTVAARGYDTAEVGRASAIISSATFIAILANFSLGSLYERFLPLAGGLTQRLVRQGTLFAATVGLVFGAAFLILGPRVQLFPTWYEAALFPAFVAVLAIYALQDQVLIGLGRARTIATKNISQSVTKLIAVAALIPLATGAAIVGSWVVPAAAITAIISVVVIRREAGRRSGPSTLPPTREVFQFFASSYVISAVTVSVPLLVPLIVVAQLGTEMNAYFSMCWLVIHTLGVLIGATAAPFIATASTPGADLRSCTARFVLMCGGAAVAGSVVLIATGPLILGILGPGYAEHGTTLIRMMALTLPSVALMTVYTALARLRRRLRLAVTAQILLGTTVVLGVIFTTPRWGLNAVGYSYLAAELLCTIILVGPVVAQLRKIAGTPHEQSPATTAAPGADRPEPPPVADIEYASVTERFGEVARAHPERVALRTTAGDLTYGALHTAATRWTAALTESDATRRVLPLVGDLTPQTAAVILGSFAAGVPLVPLDPALPPDRTRAILDTLTKHGYRYDQIATDTAEAPTAEDVPTRPPAPTIRSVTSIQFTSGSSGEPKAVLHTHGTWLSDWILHRDRFGILAGRKIALCMPVSFAAGLNVLVGSLLSGAEVIAVDPRRQPPDVVLDRLDGADIVMCTPSFLQSVSGYADGRTLDGVQRIVTTGEPVYSNVFRQARALAPNAVLTNWAGSSETLGIAHFDVWPTDDVPAGGIPAGIPVPHKHLAIDERGRLTVTSRYLAAGYLDPSGAQTEFVENPDGTATFITSDRARLTEDGVLVVLGRGDAAVKIRGYLVEPAEVEAALIDCPGIREAVVVADMARDTPVLIGYVAPEPGVRTPAVADIRAHLHTRLPDWMVPTHVVLLESLPRNERGKVDRRALPAPTRGPIEAPAPGVESEIAAEWARVLRLDEVGRNENLYALGGDSLSALQLVTTLGRRYCVDLTPSDLAAAPTVALLAEVVEARRDGLTPARQTRLAPTTVVLRAPTARSRNILFCFAGAGASALSFAPLAERAADTTAVVAFQPQGLANRAIPDWSVDRAAARHLKDLLAVQPTGPYWLAGHSLGAFIAIEVANHLRARGHDVELVTMLDPILPPKTVRAARVTLPEARSTLLDQTPAARGALWKRRLGLPLAGLLDGGPRQKEEALREVGVRVAHLHRPRPYSGPTLLVLSSFNVDDERIWAQLLPGEVTLRRIPCDHNSMIREPHIGRVVELMESMGTPESV